MEWLGGSGSGQLSEPVSGPDSERAPAVHARPRLRVAACLAPELRWLYEWVVARAGDCAGSRIELVDMPDDDGVTWQHCDGAFVCSLAFVEAADAGWTEGTQFEAVVAPVVADARAEGRPVYFSDVVVRRESPWSCFDDLRGCRWSFNEPLSQSGYGVTRYHLVRLGETEGFFGEVIEAGAHGRSIEMLLAGEIDASAIDSHLWAVVSRDRPDVAEQLKVIDVLGPSTVQPLVMATSLPRRVRECVQQSVVDLADDETAREQFEAACIERWVPVADHTYEDVRAMRDACHRAGFMELR